MSFLVLQCKGVVGSVMLDQVNLRPPADLYTELLYSFFPRKETLLESRYYVLLLVIKTWVTFGWTNNWTGLDNVSTTVADTGVKVPTIASQKGFLLRKMSLCQDQSAGKNKIPTLEPGVIGTP